MEQLSKMIRSEGVKLRQRMALELDNNMDRHSLYKKMAQTHFTRIRIDNEG